GPSNIGRDSSDGLKEFESQNSISCYLCACVFDDKKQLYFHFRKVHPLPKVYPCDLCDKRFSRTSILKDHLKTHTGEGLIPCKLCGKKFSQKSNLQRHMIVHKDERPFTCTSCDASFKIKSNLKEHIDMIHSDGASYSCSLCDKKFARKYRLTLHLNKHARESSLSCDYCSIEFRTRACFQKHMKTHRRKNAFPCDRCNKSFRDRFDLERHIKTHSKDQPSSSKPCEETHTTNHEFSDHGNAHGTDPNSVKDHHVENQLVDGLGLILNQYQAEWMENSLGQENHVNDEINEGGASTNEIPQGSSHQNFETLFENICTCFDYQGCEITEGNRCLIEQICSSEQAASSHSDGTPPDQTDEVVFNELSLSCDPISELYSSDGAVGSIYDDSSSIEQLLGTNHELQMPIYDVPTPWNIPGPWRRMAVDSTSSCYENNEGSERTQSMIIEQIERLHRETWELSCNNSNNGHIRES
ncbi:hypothetical protein QAD02_009539, partial [Eretmocerus hayati]